MSKHKPGKKRIYLFLFLSFLLTLLVYGPVKRLFVKEPLKIELTEVPEKVFYAKHIASIVNEHCIKCHRDNGAAPFVLTDYKSVFRKKTTIRKVVEKGIMPPWPADPSYSHFLGENVLSDIQKKTIYAWIEQGAKFGDSSDLPAQIKFNAVSNLGKPDITVYMDSFLVEGDNRDKFRVVKTPFQIPNDTFIRAIEFVPGKNQLVHHLNADLMNYDESKKRDVFDGSRIANVDKPVPIYESEFENLKIYHDDGSMPERFHSAVNYLPGVFGTMYPEGVGGFKVSKKSAFVARDIHYAPIAKDQWDHSHYNIFYSKSPPTRLTEELMLGTNGVSTIIPHLEIPPDTVMTFVTKLRLPQAISVLTVNPHMHLLGKKLIAYAITKEKDTIPIIRINRWDFRWQYFYTYPKMLKLEEGAQIVVEATFDNTSSNKNNPFDPPRMVKENLDKEGAGMRTTDEMFQFIITYLNYKEGDELISLDPTSR